MALPFGRSGWSVGGVAQDGAGHAAAAAAAPAEVSGGDGDALHARLAQERVGEGVAVVADDDTGLESQDVVAVVPLLAHGSEPVAAGRHHPAVDAERGRQ